ncbi:MAG: PAS domain-containing protein, partial [Akkermansiaceae bacterium]|nr:PAS domain-containing protein [Armatimonadota bacterium]
MTTRQEPRGSRSRAEGADGSSFGAAVFPALPLFGGEGSTSFDTPTIDSIDSDIRELADTVPHKMWFSGPRGGVLFLNARFTEYTGVPCERACGMGWRDVVHPDDLTECLDVRKRDEAIRCRQPWHLAYRLRRHDGEYRWHTGRTVPLFDVAGVVRRWVGTSTDIQDEKDAAQHQRRFMRDLTEQRRLEEELKAALDKQSRVMETLQNSLLMVPPPDAFPGLAIKPLYESASDDALIGGDFFDTFALAEDTIALVVGDATGHGIEAVTYTAEVKFALRVLLREYPQPAVAMERLNAFLVDKTRLDPLHGGSPYIALALCVVDTRAQELS